MASEIYMLCMIKIPIASGKSCMMLKLDDDDWERVETALNTWFEKL